MSHSLPVRPSAPLRPPAVATNLPGGAGRLARPAAPAPAKPPVLQEEATSGAMVFGFYFALTFVFLRFSLLPEIVTYKFGVNMRLALVFGVPTLLLLFLTGGIRRAFQGAAAWMFLAYLFWLLVSAPFSVWRGGTFETLKAAFLTEFSMFFIVTGLVRTYKDVQKITATIALAGVINLAVCATMGTYDNGRLMLPFGTLENPNDLAVHLILILPFFIMMFYTAGRFSPWRLLSIPAVIGAVYAVLLSGSRMALIALALSTIFIFIRSTMMQRMLILGAFGMAGIIALLFLPALTIQRYMTMFNSEPATIVDMAEYQGAVGSTEARKRLLMNSIQLTIENPLFGVGPGQFAVEEAELQRSMGRKGSWQVTHNTYTQISSEAGLPAVFFYTASIFLTLAGLRRLTMQRVARNAQLEMLSSISFCMQLSIVGLAVCSLFGSLAYRHYLPSLLGLALVFTQVARQQLDQWAAKPQAAKPTPATNIQPALPSLRSAPTI
jgi:O-antigen ligase